MESIQEEAIAMPEEKTAVQQQGNPIWRSALTILLAAAGIALMVYYDLCDTDCSYLKGDLFGIDLKYVGIGFMAALVVLVLARQTWFIRILLAGALGGEIHLLLFQVREDVFCPFCLAFAAILLAAFIVHYEFPGNRGGALRTILYLPGEVVMPFWKNVRLPLLVFALAGYLMMIAAFSGSATPAYGAENAWIPSYGKGKVEIIVFTDYFCHPCQAVEKDLEPALEEFLAKGRATVTFVDMPIYRQTPLYAKYFLYGALNKGYREALHVRRELFDLAKGSAPGSDADLSAALRARHVSLTPHDEKPTFQAWNGIIRNYKVNSTPTMVVRYAPADVRTYRGGMEIRQGLEQLRKALPPARSPGKAGRGKG
jgi:thiol-disulfide isomerase/thioredoxin